MNDTEVKIEDLRQPCEVYSRIVGYIRPLDSWNDAKVCEFEDRLEFKLPEVK